MMPPLRIAVVGTGLIGRKHIRLIAQNPNFALAATVNPSGKQHDVPEAAEVPNFVSHTALIAGSDIGAAIISSPNETHADIAVDFIETGVPVLIEKPLASSVEDGLRILEAADRCGVPVLVGHHRRYNPIIQEMKTLVDQSKLGDLVGFSGTWSTYKPNPYYETPWRIGTTGGLVLINLIHEIDCLHATLGLVEAVGALQGRKRRAHPGEEAVALMLRFESGVVGTIMISDSAASPWTWEQATGENEPSFRMTAQSPYRFLFEKGAVEFPSLKQWTQTVPDWTNPIVPDDPNRLSGSMESVFADQIDHFYHVAAHKTQPRVTVRDGLQALKVAMAVKDAIATPGHFVEVPRL